MIKHSFIFFLFSFFLLGFAEAQVPKGMGASDPNAKAVLDAISKKFKTYQTVQAKFSLQAEDPDGKSMGTKTGTLYMKGPKYRISMTGQEIYSDGSNVWTYDKEAKEVTISKYDPDGSTLTPQKLFTSFYNKEFLSKRNEDVQERGKKMASIELTPIDKTKPFHKVLLSVYQNNIATTRVYEKTGNKYTYSTTYIKSNGVLSDALFVFNAKAYPGIEVVDLR